MSDTFTQIHIHAVAAVKYRAALIRPAWNQRLHQYITGIVQNKGHKMLCINTMPDHLHFFFGFRPTQSLADLMRLVKGESSEWINKQRLTPSHFHWQSGYGAFSYARSQVHNVISLYRTPGGAPPKKDLPGRICSVPPPFRIALR